MLAAIYEEARFCFSTLAFRRRKRSMFFGFRASVFDFENEFWFSTSFSWPIGIGRRTLCQKAKTLFGFSFLHVLHPKGEQNPVENVFVFKVAFSLQLVEQKWRVLAKQGVMLSFDEEGPRKFERKKRAFRYNFRAACYPSSFLFLQLSILRSRLVARCQSVWRKRKTETRFWNLLFVQTRFCFLWFFLPVWPENSVSKTKMRFVGPIGSTLMTFM